mmetsp:Transcript_8516/g.22000  ORF Transcript_8516/g.22000 Transcript_8516/m.22000 type:complete len:352 (-) Transcript_8516:264-1319(-)
MCALKLLELLKLLSLLRLQLALLGLGKREELRRQRQRGRLGIRERRQHIALHGADLVVALALGHGAQPKVGAAECRIAVHLVELLPHRLLVEIAEIGDEHVQLALVLIKSRKMVVAEKSGELILLHRGVQLNKPKVGELCRACIEKVLRYQPFVHDALALGVAQQWFGQRRRPLRPRRLVGGCWHCCRCGRRRGCRRGEGRGEGRCSRRCLDRGLVRRWRWLGQGGGGGAGRSRGRSRLQQLSRRACCGCCRDGWRVERRQGVHRDDLLDQLVVRAISNHAHRVAILRVDDPPVQHADADKVKDNVFSRVLKLVHTAEADIHVEAAAQVGKDGHAISDIVLLVRANLLVLG